MTTEKRRCLSFLLWGAVDSDDKQKRRIYCGLPSGHYGWHALAPDRKGAQWRNRKTKERTKP